MKLAKKVLSVVLAMVLALSAFAVVGSANGDPDTATHHAKVWLTGSAGSAVWSSNAKVTITEGDESEAGGTLEVQPGDHVFVRLYATNDYYVHTFQANLFYSAELIDGYEDYFVQRPSASSFSAANQKKIHIWNTNNEWAAAQGTSYSAQNFWTYQNDTFNADVEQNWPTDDEGNNLFNMEEWKFNRLNNLVSENSGWTNIWEDTDNHLIMMTLKVPEDAQPGDTFYVTIPEGTEQREAKPKGALRLYENGVCADCEEPCEVVDTQSSLNPNMKYGDEYLYWDLSEATLTITIPGSSEPEIDYTALEEKIEEAKAVDTSNATASSKSALEAAITAAEALVGNASSDADVTAMIKTLDDAIAAVENLANYTALNEALAEYATLNSADWTTDTWAAVEEAYATASAIEEGLGVSVQGTIDAAATALATAIDNLAPNLDYSALEAKVNEVKDTDTSIYTVDTAGRFNNALAYAQNMVDNKTATSQDDITNALAELRNSHAGLTEKDADYSALETAKGKYVALNAKDWTSASYTKATEAYNAALAVPAGLKISAQGTIDAAAQALEDAITALVPATGADYSALDKAIEDAKALVADHYTTDSYAAVETALAAAEAVARDLTSEDQATIDEAEKALTDAMGALVPADADYSAVETAKAAAAAKVAENDEGTLRYADEWIAEVNAAVEAVVEGLKKKDQATVDGYAAAINALLAAPVYRAYDYTAINEHIAAIEANPVDYYDADSYAEYLAKKEALVWNYTHEQYAKAKLQQIQFLKVTVKAAGPADYSEVEAAEEAFIAKKAAATYTDDSIAAVQAVIDSVNWDLNANHQAEVDAYAEAIREATDKMVEVVIEYADYAALDAAIADAANYAADAYTAASYAALTDAVADGNAVARDLLKADQAKVDDAAKAIVDAIAALEAKADYTALDAAIRDGNGYDPNVWTEETYAVLADALAAAAEVNRDLGESSQATIDAAAKAITDAIAGLKEKEVKAKIMTINWTPSEDTHNTFTVSVEDRPAMIQFIEEDGGTRTYDRYNKNVTIVSYNADGVEVNSLSRDVAYEVWTINTNLIGPDVKARAKYLSGTSYIWETETYNFTVEVLKPVYDAKVRSIGPAATSGKKGAVSTVVITGPDAQAIRFVMDNNTTTTYSADKAYVLANGDLMFTGNAWMNNDGLNIVKVQIKVAGVWTDAGTVEYTVE